MILSRSSMLAVEQQTFARGISANVLMETAGAKLARCITQFFPKPGLLVCYAGKGHNAGDAFVAARHLAMDGWRVLVRTPFIREDFTTLTRDKLDLLSLTLIHAPFHPSHPQDGPLVQLDALVGLGAQGSLRAPLASLAEEMNTLRQNEGAHTIAVDFPSGLDPDIGVPSSPCVIADITATVGFVKAGLVADSATNYVGRLAVLEVPDFIPSETSGDEILTSSLLRPLWPPRNFDTHKGQCGRALLLAGSRGTLGAAHLASAGALRAGAGLIFLGALADTYELLATTTPPEIMVHPLNTLTDAFSLPCDALGIGPGLGTNHGAVTLRLMREITCPAVVDADALTILAHGGLPHIDKAKGPRLLTPHPGEMERLLGGKKVGIRAVTARTFVEQHSLTLLLKGARTLIAEQGHPLRYNTTGNPGMATGGMGDVLTGVCTALLAQRLTTRNAASLGAWLCGRAAEIAITNKSASPESLTPTDILRNLPLAFDSLRAGDF